MIVEIGNSYVKRFAVLQFNFNCYRNNNNNNTGESTGNAFFVINESKGEVSATWAWIIMENMSVKLIGNYESANYTKDAAITAYYVNPNRTFELLKVGGNIASNKTWK